MFDPGIHAAITTAVVLLLFGVVGGILEKRRQRRRVEEAHAEAMQEWRLDHLVGERLDLDAALGHRREVA